MTDAELTFRVRATVYRDLEMVGLAIVYELLADAERDRGPTVGELLRGIYS
jgi:hypothetical protein